MFLRLLLGSQYAHRGLCLEASGIRFDRVAARIHGTGWFMSIEYIAVIADEDYDAFKILVSTPLPREYDMWL
jgi:hypothetical protein